MNASSGIALARAIRNLGAPTGVNRALVSGGDALIRAVRSELAPIDLSVAGGLHAGQQTDEPFDLIILTDAVAAGALADVRERVRAAAERLRPETGRLVLYLATLAAPLAASEAEAPFGPHDALLFPESVAAGDIGASAARMSRLSVSSWRLLAASLGLEIIAEGGQGDQRLPSSLFRDHEARLAVLDRTELTTGRILMVLRHKEVRS